MKKRLSLQEFVVTRQAAAAMASQDATAEVADSEVKKSKKKDDKKAGKGTTDTGMPKNEIELNPQMDTTQTMYEQKDSHVVFAFGRMNPPTVGHEKLVDAIKAHAKKVGGEAHIYLSKTHDKKKNPLDYETKHAFAKKAFGDVVKHTPEGSSNVHGILKHLHSLGHTHATLIAGDDRVEDYRRIANTYNGPGKDYNFKKIEVRSAGARDPDAEGVEGMSASKMRAHASAGNHKEFKAGLPKNLQPHHKAVMNTLRTALHEEVSPEELLEVVSVQSRIKKAARARSMKGRLAMGRRRALKRRASRSTLQRRSQRTARKFMRARMLRGQKYSDLSYSARAALDRRLKIKSKSVNRLAMKLLPRISSAEQRRKPGQAFRSPRGLGAMAGVAGVREAMVMIMKEQSLPSSIIESLQKKSNQYNIPFEILETVYYRGLADFASGHRPTLTSQQWAFNRVNSFVSEGLTYHTADKDLAEGAMDVKRAQKAALQLHKKDKKTVEEDLRKWFKQKWVRMDTKGNIKGDCAREEGEGKPKCLPVAKARAMDKDDRAAAVRRKRREDPVADRSGKGEKPINVTTEACWDGYEARGVKKKGNRMVPNCVPINAATIIDEKNVPTSPDKWAQAKAQAKAKFDVYPSAYANGWAAKKYKAMGGGWKSVSESYDVNSKHYKALTDLDLNTKNRDLTTKEDGYGPLNPNDLKGSKPFWEEKAKLWNTTVEAAMEARCRNCAAFNQSSEVLKKMAEGLGPAGDKIQELSNLGFCELFEFKCAGDRSCNKWLMNGPITEEGGAGYEGTPELVNKLKQDTPGQGKKLSFKDFV